MSYILDALKKSSESRAKLGFGGELEGHSVGKRIPSDNFHIRSQAWLPWLIAVLALLWGAIMVLSTPGSTPTSQATPEKSTIPALHPETKTPTQKQTETVPRKHLSSLTQPPPRPASTPTMEAAPPPDVKTTIEAVAITAHMYSARHEDRLMIIENRAVREGDRLDSGIKVDQITPDGAILILRGHKVHRAVFN